MIECVTEQAMVLMLIVAVFCAFCIGVLCGLTKERT